MNLLKTLLPDPLKQALRALKKSVTYSLRRVRIKIPVLKNEPIKVIVGAAETSQKGWYSTNQQWHDITDPNDWQKIFRGKRLITHLVAEHVFEHLTEAQSDQALTLIAEHLLPGGRLRIAVPDGYNPNAEYLKNVGICGIGADAADHKQLYNLDRLEAQLKSHGFTVEHVEGFDAKGSLKTSVLNPDHGKILRSRSNPIDVSRFAGWNFVDSKSSLIVDGVKVSS